MIIQLEKTINPIRKNKILLFLTRNKFEVTEVKTNTDHYLVGIGKGDVDIRRIGHLPGVQDVFRVSDNFKLVSRKWKTEPTRIDLGDEVQITEGELSLMMGPCAIDNEDNIDATLDFLNNHHVKIMRGGVFKPRSSPYSFRGRGIECLKQFYKAAQRRGVKIITEVMNEPQIKQMIDYVDVFQVGARNTQNFSLLEALGKTDKPVLIKRGISGTIDELLHSAEYVFSSGNEKLILCERGIRTFENVYRNTLDLNAVPILKAKTHLPVIVDPSHGVGLRQHIIPMSLAAIMSGADGLIVEIHPEPDKAISDSRQTIDFRDAEKLISNCREVFKLKQQLL